VVWCGETLEETAMSPRYCDRVIRCAILVAVAATWLPAAETGSPAATSDVPAPTSTTLTPREIFAEAVGLFFAGEPRRSAEAFDRLVTAAPDRGPDLWQRGLALYYADRFAEGRRQFELHRTVNPDDVENPAWHFLCVARLEGADVARRSMLPVGHDRRVPMPQILELFAGRGDAAAVLAAAEQGEGEARRNQLCYAHLYLGLHAEAVGDAEAARRHITQAAGPFRMDHYMGRVAVLHARLRGWPVE